MALDQGSTLHANAVGTETSRRPDFSFGRASKIRSAVRFSSVFDSGEKRVGRYVVAWCAPQNPAGDEPFRLGVVSAKRTFRHAVDRNRARRLVREAFRLLRPGFAGSPRDLVIVAKRRILEASGPEVREDLRRLCAAFGYFPAGEASSC